MLLSLNWLQEFVPFSGTAEELGSKLTMLGLELDGITRPFDFVNQLVIGHVDECNPHPDSDHLSVTKVNIGTEVLDIVCGAPNVGAGQFVVVAPVGATLPGGLKIKKAKLRGQPSCGMICSERELGLSDDHAGIMVLQDLLDGPFTVGENALKALKLDSEILEISITPNRGDCLSVLGIAREVAMAYSLPLTLPSAQFDSIDSSSSCLDKFNLTVINAEQCPFYSLKAIEGVTVGKSPAPLRWRLAAVGLRSISNVVDITNYILMELGQPLHSFDMDKVKGSSVIVSSSVKDEMFDTLDGQERKLDKHDITIRDADGPIALGGVMGGLDSEVESNTKNILLEGAIFNPSSIRFTSRRLGLSSDASYRYERGVNEAGTPYALSRAASLIAKTCGGKLSSKTLSSGQHLPVIQPIGLRLRRAEAILGVELGNDFCVKTLESLGCKISEVPASDRLIATLQDEYSLPFHISGTCYSVTAPHHRKDLLLEADLIEELARVYGVDRIPEIVPEVPHSLDKAGAPITEFQFLKNIKLWASGLGLNEAINYSFVGQKDLDSLKIPKDGQIRIMNPLTSEQDVLRPVLAPGVLNTLRENLSQGIAGVRIFEIARGFTEDTTSETRTNERNLLALLLYGDRFGGTGASAWPQTNDDADYADIKGIIEHLFAQLHIDSATFSMSEAPCPWFRISVDIKINHVFVGTIGRLQTDMAKLYHAKKDIWVAELELDAIRKITDAHKISFTSLPVYPPVRRDITVIVPQSMEAGKVQQAIIDMKPANLEDITQVDCYQPSGSNDRNITFRLTFRHANKTLQDADVDKARDKVAAFLVESLQLRV